MNQKAGLYSKIQPKTAARLTAYCKRNDLKKGEVVNFALQKLFKEMPVVKLELR